MPKKTVVEYVYDDEGRVVSETTTETEIVEEVETATARVGNMSFDVSGDSAFYNALKYAFEKESRR